jgi:soluble lytic murein transglycosylase-like protein
MTRFPRIALVILFGCAPALAQNTAYSFDNFDTPSGIRVHAEQPKARPTGTRSRRPTRTASSNKTAVEQDSMSPTTLDSPRSMVSPTVLTYDPLAAIQSNSSSLRGYTTGSSEVDGYLVSSGARHGVDPLLLYSVMHQESSFKSRAISPKGARGLMQLMPLTAARYGVTNIFDPKQNIEGGARYLRFLLDHFDGDLNLALAGYNAGEGAVEKYGWRIPPYSETQEYVRRISRRYGLLRDPNAALYAPRLSSGQIAKLRDKQTVPLTMYERTVLTVRLPDGRLQLMSQ